VVEAILLVSTHSTHTLVMALSLSVAALGFNAPLPAAVASRSAVRMAFEGEINPGPQGVYDPLGLVADGDQEKFDRLRYVELKHGRICMLAILGHVVTSAGVRLPGELSFGLPFASVPTGIKALSVVPAAGLAQIFAFVGFLELFVMKDVEGTGEFPGDFRNGFIDFGWDNFTEEEKASKRGIELNNGRAAQMGILALMVHEMLDNNPYIINDLLGAPVPFNAGF